MRFLVFLFLFPLALQAQSGSMPPIYGSCLEEDIEERKKCSHRNIQHFIETNLQYPAKALSAGQEGLVMIQLSVDKSGLAHSPNILLSKCKNCKSEALRLASGLSEWSPASEDGKAKETQISIPIYFTISDSLQQNKQMFLKWGANNLSRLTKDEALQLWESPIEIYDNFGKQYPVNELYVAFETKEALQDAYSRSGKKTKEMKKVIRQAEAGGVLVLYVYTNQGIVTKPVYKMYEIVE